MDAIKFISELEDELDDARAYFQAIELWIDDPESAFQSATGLIELFMQRDVQAQRIQATRKALDHARQELKQANHGPEN